MSSTPPFAQLSAPASYSTTSAAIATPPRLSDALNLAAFGDRARSLLLLSALTSVRDDAEKTGAEPRVRARAHFPEFLERYDLVDMLDFRAASSSWPDAGYAVHVADLTLALDRVEPPSPSEAPLFAACLRDARSRRPSDEIEASVAADAVAALLAV